MGQRITNKRILEFREYLIREEKEENTVEKYVNDVKKFALFINNDFVTKEVFIKWKNQLIASGYMPSSVNSMIASVNCYCRFAELDIKVKLLKIQKKLFYEESKCLTKSEYERLIITAKESGKSRLSLLLETIGSTGIRVSEVKYVTVESVSIGKAQIVLKGKIRTILFPRQLCKKLLKYAKKQKIAFGEIFITRSGKGISRKQIWSEMKSICSLACVEVSKVFPHNLRHLFARSFYRVTKDISKLADILGHNSLETTRIYLLSSDREHSKKLEMLHLVL